MAKIPRHTLAASLAKQSLGSVNAKQFSEHIAAYLIAERRTADLESLMRDVMQYRADNGIVEVVAVSAHDLTPEVRKDIEAQIKSAYPQAKQVIISEQHDSSVVGGVRLELANEQLDLSVRAKLNRFKQLTVTGRN